MENIKLQYIRKVLRRYFGRKRLKILDIGCSNDYGYFKDTEEFVGVDVISPKLKPPKLIIQNLERKTHLPFKKNHFDVVMALDILEHLNNRHEIMEELKRVTKKEGKLIVSLPNEFSYQPIWYHIKGVNWISGGDFGHKYFYGLKTAREYIEKHLKILELKYLYLDGKFSFLGAFNQFLAENFPRWFARNVIYICQAK